MTRSAVCFGMLALFAGCASSSSPEPTLSDLHDIEELRTRFDADTDAVRIVLLMSPT